MTALFTQEVIIYPRAIMWLKLNSTYVQSKEICWFPVHDDEVPAFNLSPQFPLKKYKRCLDKIKRLKKKEESDMGQTSEGMGYQTAIAN